MTQFYYKTLGTNLDDCHAVHEQGWQVDWQVLMAVSWDAFNFTPHSFRLRKAFSNKKDAKQNQIQAKIHAKNAITDRKPSILLPVPVRSFASFQHRRLLTSRGDAKNPEQVAVTKNTSVSLTLKTSQNSTWTFVRNRPCSTLHQVTRMHQTMAKQLNTCKSQLLHACHPR